MHYIKVSVVEELVKKAIHTVSSFAIGEQHSANAEKYIRRLDVLSDFQVETAIKKKTYSFPKSYNRLRADDLIPQAEGSQQGAEGTGKADDD